MSEPKCLLCGGSVASTSHACGDRPTIEVGRCSGCGLVQLMSMSHVSVDYYAADSYFPQDTNEIFLREQSWNVRRIKRLKRDLPDHKRRRVLDFGCGVGGFLRRACDHFGFVIGFDVSPRMTAMHRAAGFGCVSRIEEVPADIDTITLFHVLEHVVKPWELLESLRKRFPSADRFVLETPNTGEALLSLFGSKPYRRNHYSADHVYYFTNATLRAVAEKAGLRVLVDSQMQRYPLGNTFGWLAEGKGGGQNKWPWFSADRLHEEYEAALAAAGVADSVFLVCEPAVSE